jgi:membrane-associated HD superfamily phosphohydrolase
MSKIYTKVSKS